MIIFEKAVSIKIVDAPVTDTEGHELESGLLCMIAGQAGLGAGIPLWIVGANNQKGYTKKLQQLSVRVNNTQQTHGLTLSYRF